EVRRAHQLKESQDLVGHDGFNYGEFGGDDFVLLLKARIFDPMIKTAALERVVNLARPVGRKENIGAVLCADRADFGNRDLKVGKHLQEKRFELHVSAGDLVDQ